MKDFTKKLRLGTIPAGYPKARRDVFAKVEFKAGALSVSGVVGPMANGDAHGSAGQIIMDFKEYDDRGDSVLADIAPAQGWGVVSLKRFFDIWSAWHLNNMRAGCEHQTGDAWDTSKKIEVVSYGFTGEAYEWRKEARRIAAKAAEAGVVAPLTPRQRAMVASDHWFKDIPTPPDADSPLSGCYEVKKRETKAAGWVYPSEHPSGLLGKPCFVCGYKYGTAWLKKDVPVDVLDWLRALPDADVRPAWL